MLEETFEITKFNYYPVCLGKKKECAIHLNKKKKTPVLLRPSAESLYTSNFMMFLNMK